MYGQQTMKKANEGTSGQHDDYIIKRLKQGSSRETIIAELVKQNVTESEAVYIVDQTLRKIKSASEKERFQFDKFTMAIVGGLLAAIIGGLIWGGLVWTTGYELGFVAWGLGWLSGYTVLLFTGKHRGLYLQLTAVASAALGVAIGKYITLYFFFQNFIETEYGLDAVEGLSPLSAGAFMAIMENFTASLSLFDILWVVFAVVTAWKIPRGLGLKI